MSPRFILRFLVGALLFSLTAQVAQAERVVSAGISSGLVSTIVPLSNSSYTDGHGRLVSAWKIRFATVPGAKIYYRVFNALNDSTGGTRITSESMAYADSSGGFESEPFYTWNGERPFVGAVSVVESSMTPFYEYSQTEEIIL